MLRITYPDNSVHEISKAPDGTVSMAYRSVITIGGESDVNVDSLFDLLTVAIRDHLGVMTYAD